MRIHQFSSATDFLSSVSLLSQPESEAMDLLTLKLYEKSYVKRHKDFIFDKIGYRLF